MESRLREASVTDLRHYDAAARCHSHAHHQIILPLRGALELQIEGQSGRVAALQGAIVPGDSRHTFRGIGDNRLVVVDVPPRLDALRWSEELRRLLDTPRFFALDPGLYHYTRFVGTELSREASNARMSSALAGLLVELLSRRHAAEANKPIRLARRLGPALEYIQSRFDQRMSVRKLAALSHLSVGRFHAAFQAYMDRTPAQYVAEIRMQRAVTLLKETALSVAQVAEAVGYSTQSAFTHAFKRHFGVAPSRYHHRAGLTFRDDSSGSLLKW